MNKQEREAFEALITAARAALLDLDYHDLQAEYDHHMDSRKLLTKALAKAEALEVEND